MQEYNKQEAKSHILKMLKETYRIKEKYTGIYIMSFFLVCAIFFVLSFVIKYSTGNYIGFYLGIVVSIAINYEKLTWLLFDKKKLIAIIESVESKNVISVELIEDRTTLEDKNINDEICLKDQNKKLLVNFGEETFFLIENIFE